MSNTSTKDLLQSVGMKTFVDCFDDRQRRGDLRSSEVSRLCQPDSNGWTEGSLSTKTSKLNKIFRENRQREALKLCCDAQRVDEETRKNARNLYKDFP